VLRTTVRQVDKVLTVALADAKTHKLVERITATREHPFYVRGRGFTPAGGLAVGNAIVTRAGPTLAARSVTWRGPAEAWASETARRRGRAHHARTQQRPRPAKARPPQQCARRRPGLRHNTPAAGQERGTWTSSLADVAFQTS